MGDDDVFGGEGDDSVYVDFGNDWYHGGAGSDTLIFTAVDAAQAGGSSENYEAVVFDLQKTTQNLGSLGIDTFYGFENITGGSGNDRLSGNNGVNLIYGSYGNDLIVGRGGNDTLTGAFGGDTLQGNGGADTLYGSFDGITFDEGTRDTFQYLKTSESGTTAATRDTITGFFNGGVGNGDKIDLRAIDANRYDGGNQKFKFIGTGNFHRTEDGEVRVTASGGGYLVQVDTDKDKAAEMTIFVNGPAMLEKGDFLL